MEEIKIRPANKRDTYQILSLVEQLNPNAKSSELSLPMRVMQLDRILKDEAYHPLVAIIDENIVGYGLLVERYNLTHDGRSIGNIEDIVVDEEHRGKGIGRKIVSTLIDISRELEVYKVQLHHKQKRRFYEGLGFNLVAEELMEIRFDTNL